MTNRTYETVVPVLRRLHERGVPYVVLRFSPTWSPTEHELDLLVPPRTKARFIRSLVDALPAGVFAVGTKSGVTGARLLLLAEPSDDPSEALALDIREVIHKRDVLLADYRAVTDDGVHLQGGLPGPAPHIQAAFLIARNVWADRDLSPRHHDILSSSWSDAALVALPKFLVRSRGATYRDVIEVATPLTPPRRQDSSRLLTQLLVVLRHGTVRSLLRRGGRPSVLALHGPDGTGKTTVAALVADDLRRRGVRVVAQHYAGAEIDAAYLESQQRRTTSPAATPTGAPPPRRARVMRLLLFPARHVQFRLDIHRKSAADVIIYDRFAFDHLFKGDVALAISPAVREVVARLARPLRTSRRTVNLVLVTDADTIRARKAEMSAEQIGAYFDCARRYFGADATWISAEPPPPEVGRTALSEFLSGIDRKLRRHWRVVKAPMMTR